MSIRQKVLDIKLGELTATQNVNDFLKTIDEKNKELNIFLHLNSEAIKQAKEIDLKIKQGKETGKLAGICVAVKSNISVKGLETNCASKVLEGYISGYDATVIKKLKDEDAIILGMVNMDEFACGGTGESSAFGPTKNPINSELIPGGSSSGSASAVAAKMCDFALGSDTGGSIRNPASHCGVVGLKPTYGSVSRYGLLDMAMSLDQIGPITNSVEDSKFVFDVIKGQDDLDATTQNYKEVSKKNKYKIGVVNIDELCDKNIEKLFLDRVKKISKDYEITNVNLPLDIAIETYYLLVYVEFFSSTRKYDGRRFGKKIEDFAGLEVIRRIIGGSEITRAEHGGRHYQKALKARAYIKKKFDEIFKEVDLIILPTVPALPHKIGDKISTKEMYAGDVFTSLANIAGLPAISIPMGIIDGKPTGLQILAKHGYENWLMDFGGKIEE